MTSIAERLVLQSAIGAGRGHHDCFLDYRRLGFLLRRRRRRAVAGGLGLLGIHKKERENQGRQPQHTPSLSDRWDPGVRGGRPVGGESLRDWHTRCAPVAGVMRWAEGLAA